MEESSRVGGQKEQSCNSLLPVCSSFLASIGGCTALTFCCFSPGPCNFFASLSRHLGDLHPSLHMETSKFLYKVTNCVSFYHK